MISVLHIAFKVPLNLFANGEPTLNSSHKHTAVQDLKPKIDLHIDHSKDEWKQSPERDVVAPSISTVCKDEWRQSPERDVVAPSISTGSPNNQSNNSHTSTSPTYQSNNSHTTTSPTHKSQNEHTPLLTDIPKPFDIQHESVNISEQEIVECSNDSESMCEEQTSKEISAKGQAVVSQKDDIFIDTETQTDEEIEPVLTSIGTMTLGPNLVDVSVNTHQRLCKIVKNCGTSTSGPFMKKLRRAQRLLKEAKFKAKVEQQDQVVKWRVVMDRYKDKLTKLFENLEKKDRLLGYTALNRALSENEVKEICTAVRSSRDRLHTQCKLNSALREVIESKSETPTPVCPTTCR